MIELEDEDKQTKVMLTMRYKGLKEVKYVSDYKEAYRLVALFIEDKRITDVEICIKVIHE